MKGAFAAARRGAVPCSAVRGGEASTSSSSAPRRRTPAPAPKQALTLPITERGRASTRKLPVPASSSRSASPVSAPSTPSAPPPLVQKRGRGRPRKVRDPGEAGSTRASRTRARAVRSNDGDGGSGSLSQSASSSPGGDSRQNDAAVCDDEEEDLGPTELVLTFERRGEGWGEELLPRAQFKRLPISRKEKVEPPSASSMSSWTSSDRSSRPASSRSSASSPSSPPSSRRADIAAAELELLLCEPGGAGLTPEEASAVVSAATSWRVTPAGRALRDRASVGRASRRAEAVIAYLQEECGLPPGREGVGAALKAAPRALLCRPARHDRWDRRFVQLAAFAARNGHCDVPEDDGDAVNAISSSNAAAAARAAVAAQQQQQAEQQLESNGNEASAVGASPPPPAVPSSPASAGLGAWAARQRAAWQAGALDAERAAALVGLGFDFGDGEYFFLLPFFFEV